MSAASSKLSADELADWEAHAAALEDIIFSARDICRAIDGGDLLSHLPADEDRRECHNAAAGLVRIAKKYLDSIRDIPGTDLSIKIRVAADSRQA